MSYCLPEASCASVRHQQETPWSSAFLCPGAHICWGEQEGTTGAESVQKALAVVVDQEMHPKGICFYGDLADWTVRELNFDEKSDLDIFLLHK